MTSHDWRPNPEDEELQRLAAMYIDRLIAGEEIEPVEIIANHPECGERILEELETFTHIGASEDKTLGTLGDYTLCRQIGRGGMGVVYDAWENSLERRVALKVLPPGVAADGRSSTRFLREAQIVAKLSHPQIVSVHATGIKDSTPWYAMEFVEGETLAQILAKLKDAEAETETPFGKKDDARYFLNLAEVFADVADGLQHAHSKGVTHRDIKPSNLILDSDGRLRILDFGLARLEGQESITLSGDFVGTPLYMSPEQARRKKIPVDHRTDVYSLGATIYEAICGGPAFRGKDHADTLSQIIDRDPVEPRKVNPRVPKDLGTIVLKCLRKDASDRYGTAEALGQDLRRFVRGDPVEARPEGRCGRFQRQVRRHRVAFGIAALVILLLGASAWFAYLAEREARKSAEGKYSEAVLSLAAKLSAGRFSLDASPISRAGEIRLTDVALTPVTQEQLRQLLRGGVMESVREAAASLEHLVAEFPNATDGHYHLARAYLLLGRKEEARRQAKLAQSLDPGFLPARVLCEQIDVLAPRAATIRQSQNGETFGQQETWAQRWLSAQRALGDRNWLDAVQVYDDLLESSVLAGKPYYGGFFLESYLGRGVAHLRLRQFDSASRNFAVAQHLAPTSLEPALLLGRTYLLEEKLTTAEEVFASFFRRTEATRRSEVALWISMVYISLRDYRGALSWARKMESGGVRERLLAYIHLQLQEWHSARAAARRAIDVDDKVMSHLLFTKALLEEVTRGPVDCDAYLALLRVTERTSLLEPTNTLAGFLQRSAKAMTRARWRAVSESEPSSPQGACVAALDAALNGLAAVAEPARVFEDFSADPDLFDGTGELWTLATPVDLQTAPDGIDLRAAGRPNVGGFLYSHAVYSRFPGVRIRARVTIGHYPDTEWHGAILGLVDLITGDVCKGNLHSDGKLQLARVENKSRFVQTDWGRVPQDAGIDFSRPVWFEFLANPHSLELRVWQEGWARPAVAAHAMQTAACRAAAVLIGVPPDRTAFVRFHELDVTQVDVAARPERLRRGEGSVSDSPEQHGHHSHDVVPR